MIKFRNRFSFNPNSQSIIGPLDFTTKLSPLCKRAAGSGVREKEVRAGCCEPGRKGGAARKSRSLLGEALVGRNEVGGAEGTAGGDWKLDRLLYLWLANPNQGCKQGSSVQFGLGKEKHPLWVPSP